MKQVDAVKQIHCQKGKGQRSVNLNSWGPPWGWGGAGAGVVLNQYLGIGEPLTVWNPDPV